MKGKIPQNFKPGLTRLFTGIEIMIGMRNGIVSKDIQRGRPGSFDERMKLEQMLQKKGLNKK